MPRDATIRHVRENDVRELLPMATAIELVERALRARAGGQAADFPRTAMRFPDGSLRVLAASSIELGLVGYKATYSATGQAARGAVHLLDARSGELRAIVESVALSILRTGAASAVATRCLAREDARVVALLGTGTQAMGQLDAIALVRGIESVRVWSRNADRSRDFCARAEQRLGIAVVPAATAAEAVRGADIVNVITSSGTPVLAGEWLERGQHINAAGSNALNRRELDAAAVERCDRIVVDARDVARSECGDLLPLVERGALDWDALPEIGEVLSGRAAGRIGPDDITLYESHGMGVQDLYTAHHVSQAAERLGIGASLR